MKDPYFTVNNPSMPWKMSGKVPSASPSNPETHGISWINHGSSLIFAMTSKKMSGIWWENHLVGGFNLPLWKMMEFVSWDYSSQYTHRIHVWYIYAKIGDILMVNVTIYSIHGSYGIWKVTKFHGSSHHQPVVKLIKRNGGCSHVVAFEAQRQHVNGTPTGVRDTSIVSG